MWECEGCRVRSLSLINMEAPGPFFQRTVGFRVKDGLGFRV